MVLSESIDRFKFERMSCSFSHLIASLNEEDRKVLLEAIEKGIPTMTLVSALRQEGYKIGEPTFNLHRQGKCKCTQLQKAIS